MLLIMKCLFLILAIMYGFTCGTLAARGQSISGAQTFLMAVGIVGFIALQWLL